MLSRRRRAQDGRRRADEDDAFFLDAARELDLPRITRVVLEDLQEQLENGSLDSGDNPVPFYYMRGGSFRRDMITVNGPVSPYFAEAAAEEGDDSDPDA